MFSVIVSEKGGAERRETFERTEINVGRVQGNDLMLPKGNVSKRHARLLYRDGRFIVTDLKSTNGTYVNGRKIAQATIVREGDKIYIGDFVLRIEPAVRAAEQPAEPPAADDKPLLEPSSTSELSSSCASAPLAVPAPFEAVIRTGEQPALTNDVISHFPLEHDPDDMSPAPQVPGPPRVPSAARHGQTAKMGVASFSVSGAAVTGSEETGLSTRASPGQPPLLDGPSQMGKTSPHLSPTLAKTNPTGVPVFTMDSARRAIPPAAPASPIPPPPPSPSRPASSAQSGAYRAALGVLLTRVAETVDVAPLSSGEMPDEALAEEIETALRTCAAAMKAASELPADVTPAALVLTARRELLELGPLGPLLEDDEVNEIHVMRHDDILALPGKRVVSADVAFSSDEALLRAIRRLCHSADAPLKPGEPFVEQRLPDGSRMMAILAPLASKGHSLTIRKPRRADLTLEDLVRSGTLSRAMATLLGHCIHARANILACGPSGSGTTSLLAALAAAGGIDDRVFALQEDDEIIFQQPHVVSLMLDDATGQEDRVLRAIGMAHPDRLVIGSFAGRAAAGVLEAIGGGIEGVLAATRAPTLRHAVARLATDLTMHQPGITLVTAQERIASAFDLAIELARLRDGRHRVTRLAELRVEGSTLHVQDIFSFNVERTAAGGAVEGSFHPSGTVPAVVQQLSARGMLIDRTLFRRQPTR